MKKTLEDIIILQMCAINDNHMMYVPEIWSTTQNFLFALDHFLPFYPSNNPKNKNFEKMKKNHFTNVCLK